MSARPLDDLLSTLRSEIGSLDLRDEEAKRRLDALALEIETRSKDPGAAVPDERLTGQLKDSVLAFEASHPRLAALMNDVLDRLSAMGI